MKKIILDVCSIIALLFVFQVAKAYSYHDIDSSAPVPKHVGNTTNLALLSESKSEGKTNKDLKKFIFSIVVTPRFATTIPPLNLYFEHGIAGLASLGFSFGGVYDSESDIDYQAATVSLGLRACGYAFPIISKITGKEINGYGFQPYLGLGYDYYFTAVSFKGNDLDAANYSNVGVIAGTRWYPGKGKFAVLAELNTNGIGNNIRLGISLGR